MRPTTDQYFINGKPLLAPDAPLEVKYEDLDAYDSGRDLSGVMHRLVVRYKVPSWSFQYSNLTREEKDYLESLFPDEPTFAFTHPDRRTGVATVTQCYRSQYGIAWRNAATGLLSGYSFRIIGC